MPFGKFLNMKSCIRKNRSKKSPGGYCAVIHKKITGSFPGASLNLQNQWKGFNSNTRNMLRRNFKDTDGDRVPDRWDCQPRNIFRQDSKPNKLMQQRIYNLPIHFGDFDKTKFKRASGKDLKQLERDFTGTLKRNPNLITELEEASKDTDIIVSKKNVFRYDEKNDNSIKLGTYLPYDKNNKNKQLINVAMIDSKPAERSEAFFHELKHREQYMEDPKGFVEYQSNPKNKYKENKYEQDAIEEASRKRHDVKYGEAIKDKIAEASRKEFIEPYTDEEYEKVKNEIKEDILEEKKQKFKQSIEFLNEQNENI